jgi:hypothetical protein
LNVGDICAVQGILRIASNCAALAARVHISGNACAIGIDWWARVVRPIRPGDTDGMGSVERVRAPVLPDNCASCFIVVGFLRIAD